MRILLPIFLLLPLTSQAAMPAIKFKQVTCKYSVDGTLKKEITQDLMSLAIDLSIAKFAQIQFGDEQLKIQYQVLIEDETTDRKTGKPAPLSSEAVVVLQNLMVGETESSVEFSATAPTWVKATNASHSVSCELKKGE